MKHYLFMLILILLSGCIAIEKEISLKTNFSEYDTYYTQNIIMSPDNTFILHQTALQYGQWHNRTVSGVYKIENGSYILNYNSLGFNNVIILTKKENYYIDQDGGLWES